MVRIRLKLSRYLQIIYSWSNPITLGTETSWCIYRPKVSTPTSHLMMNSNIFSIMQRTNSSSMKFYIIGGWISFCIDAWFMGRMGGSSMIFTMELVAVICLGWKQPGKYCVHAIFGLWYLNIAWKLWRSATLVNFYWGKYTHIQLPLPCYHGWPFH